MKPKCGPAGADRIVQRDQRIPHSALGCLLPSRLAYPAPPQARGKGRYHTGDLGCLDADGFLFIRGRRNELILRGGANVYPAEVERVLGEHPDVDAVAVLGVPDPRLGQRVAAVVQRRRGATSDEETLRAHVATSLARYKVPDTIRFVDALPRNAMNKVVKPELLHFFQ